MCNFDGIHTQTFQDEQEYQQYLLGMYVPQGFAFFGSSFDFVAPENPSGVHTMNVSALLSIPQNTLAAGVMTKHALPGASVLLAKDRVEHARLLIVNNKIANDLAYNGLEDAKRVAAAGAAAFGCDEVQTLSISTGIIGWKLPVEKMVMLLNRLPHASCPAPKFAEAIMTTDRYPKMSRYVFEGSSRHISSDGSSITPCMIGIAKGSGMICPHMATMLGFVCTDAVLTVSRKRLKDMLANVVDETFNRISVDGDQSPSDMVVFMANGASGIPISEKELYTGLYKVCSELAYNIVRNGEGSKHLIHVRVWGLPVQIARKVGKAIINSLLVKTAIYGNDPNAGRVMSAIGDVLGREEADVDCSSLCMEMFGRVLFCDGSFALGKAVEEELSIRMRSAAMDPVKRGYPQYTGDVDIGVDFSGSKVGEAVSVIGSDLGYEYIQENADYRS